MVLDSGNVRVAVTGAWYVAPLGSTIPDAVDSVLGPEFVDLGYLTDAGTTKATARSTTDIKGWQNSDLLRRITTEASTTWKFVLAETNRAAAELYLGTTIGPDGSVDVNPAKTGGRKMFVFDILDGDEMIRFVLPEAEVSAIGDQTFSSGAEIGYDITLTSYPSKELTDNASYRMYAPALADAS